VKKQQKQYIIWTILVVLIIGWMLFSYW